MEWLSAVCGTLRAKKESCGEKRDQTLGCESVCACIRISDARWGPAHELLLVLLEMFALEQISAGNCRFSEISLHVLSSPENYVLVLISSVCFLLALYGNMKVNMVMGNRQNP